MSTCVSVHSQESHDSGQDATQRSASRSACESTNCNRPIECTECRSGLLHLTPKTGVQRILAMLLLRPQKVWRCHACGRTLDVA